MNISDAITAFLPGVKWSMKGSDLATLKLPNGTVAPTSNQVTTYLTTNSYKEARAAAYPPLADLADALVHQAAGDASYLTAYYAACEAVKAKFPKP